MLGLHKHVYVRAPSHFIAEQEVATCPEVGMKVPSPSSLQDISG